MREIMSQPFLKAFLQEAQEEVEEEDHVETVEYAKSYLAELLS